MMKETRATFSRAPRIFPVTALVGQEQMKLALCLLAIHPRIGGLLLRGQKGTAKSTAVRGLAALNNGIENVASPSSSGREEVNILGSSLSSSSPSSSLLSPSSLSLSSPSPFIELPLGATEEMVVGAVDFEAAIKHGEHRFLPGLLQRVHGGILYVDEVNLLDDHLVDCILDAAESGVNRVEREGLQICHPSLFALVGSMNPEEGELRPQLLDRFGLSVEVMGDTDLDKRMSLMRRRERFDRDPAGFVNAFQKETDDLKYRIVRARKTVDQVVVPGRLLGFVAEICKESNVSGHRADLAIVRAARAHAAWMGRDEVTEEDVQSVASMALLHRARNAAPPAPMEPPPLPDAENDADTNADAPETTDGRNDAPDTSGDSGSEDASSSGDDDQSRGVPDRPDTGDATTADKETVFNVGLPFRVRSLPSKTDQKRRCGSGRRSRSRSANKQGRYVRSTTERQNGDIALDATLRAAAPFQKMRREKAAHPLAIHIHENDIREKIRERRLGNVLVFAVDGSGSMGAMQRMVETKGAIMSLLVDAYQKRDKVSLVVFRGQTAEVILPPTGSVALASRLLSELPIGGRTPLSAGLCRLAEVLGQTARKDPLAQPIAVVITDGRANAALGEGPAHREALGIAEKMGRQFEQTRFIVVDTEQKSAVRLGLARRLANALFADCFEPETLCAGDLVDLIKERY
jgi:magnesium chelatase subunit D